jgi:membrane dipeptidase
MRHPVTLLLAATLAAGLAACAPAHAADPGARARAEALMQQSFVMDLHTDTLLLIEHLGYDFGAKHHAPFGFMPWMGHVDLPRAREGKLKAMFMGVVANPLWGDGRAQIRETLRVAHAEVLDKYPDQIALAWSADDFTRTTDQGKIAVQFLVEGAHGLGENAGEALPFLDEIYAQGVRVLGLAHFTDNHFAASSAQRGSATQGLSADGRAVIRRMNELGMAVDLAHVSHAGFMEAVTLSTAPVIVSHTGVAALKNVFRNVSDEEIRAVAKTGGVIGVMYAPTWLSTDLNPPVSIVVDHMRHIKQLVGARHIALGSDFDGFIWLPKEMWDVRDLPTLTAAMAAGGFSEAEIRGILGENILRTLRVIESRATRRIPRPAR